MKKLEIALFLTALCVAPVTAAGDVPPVKTLIFSGHNNHDWRSTTPHLKDVLTRSGRFDVRVVEEPAGISAQTLARYDLIVLDYMGPRWGEATEKAVEQFVRSGKGLVAVHGASYAFTGLEVLGDRHRRTGLREALWPEYLKMIGGHWVEGERKTGHGARHSFRVKWSKPEHPIAQGMGEMFWATDELYHQVSMDAGAQVLATAFSDKSTGGTGRDEPILWVVQYGQGRVFHTALGHDVAAMQAPGFIASFARGAEWAATGKVTLAAEPDWMRPAKEAVRALLVTGGHDHDVSFYSVFQNQPKMIVNTDSQPAAFRQKLKERYDVLVLYDTNHELNEAAQKNVREYLESGKGLVVVHHAIVDFGSWDWWWKDVVGGRYVLKATPELPASSYKHDVELFVKPVAKHPIVDSVGPLHIWDETYKNMWISPQVKVLMTTDHPTSDGPVVWISPYEKSRVVFVQLGHGPEAHVHAGFRQLITNAVLWAAGKM